MTLDTIVAEKRGMTFFIICCISLFLWLYFLNRDIARIGVYLLAFVGLFLIFKNEYKGDRKKLVLNISFLFFILMLLAFFLSNACCSGTDYFNKPFIHMLVLFPFVLSSIYLSGWMKWLLNASLFYIVVCIISYSLSDHPLHSAKYFESHYAVYLIAAPIAYIIHKNIIHAKTILFIFSISGIIIGLGAIADLSGIARSQFWLFDEYPDEPNLTTVGIGLGMNSIHFAIVTVSLLATVIAYLSMAANRNNKIEIALAVISILFLLFALAMSGGRSAWISLPFVFILPIVMSSWSAKVKLSFFMLLVLVLALALQMPYVQKRVNLVSEQITEYMNSTDVNDSVRSSTSVGLRFELWRAAWEVFLSKPIIGAGPGNFRSRMQEIGLGTSDKFNHDIQIHKNPHSLYFKALAERGVFGLVSTFLMLVLPGVLFLSHMSRMQSNNIRVIALSGLLIVIIFSLGGLTIGSLHKTELSIFYIFFSALFFGLLLSEKSNA